MPSGQPPDNPYAKVGPRRAAITLFVANNRHGPKTLFKISILREIACNVARPFRPPERRAGCAGLPKSQSTAHTPVSNPIGNGDQSRYPGSSRSSVRNRASHGRLALFSPPRSNCLAACSATSGGTMASSAPLDMAAICASQAFCR